MMMETMRGGNDPLPEGAFACKFPALFLSNHEYYCLVDSRHRSRATDAR